MSVMKVPKSLSASHFSEYLKNFILEREASIVNNVPCDSYKDL